MQKIREPEVIQRTAENHYSSGFNCAESVCRAITETYRPEDSQDAVRSAGYFGGGIAGTHDEVCGALSGGIIALGLLQGRSKPGEPLSGKTLAAEFKDRFLERNGHVRCHALIEGLEETDRKTRCRRLTGEAARSLSVLLNREDVIRSV